MAATHSTITPAEVKQLRMSLGLTQDQLAALVGVQRTSVTHWESGIRSPSGSAEILLRQLFGKIRKNIRRRA